MSHAIRVETSKTSSGTPIETLLRQFRANHSEAEILQEQAFDLDLIEPTPYDEETGVDVSYRRMVARFDENSASRQGLLQALESVLSSNAKWFRILYHSCEHELPPEERTGGCEWKVVASGGSPPAGLPDYPEA